MTDVFIALRSCMINCNQGKWDDISTREAMHDLSIELPFFFFSFLSFLAILTFLRHLVY